MNTQYPVQPTQPKTAKRKMNWFDNSLVSTATQAVTVCPAKIWNIQKIYCNSPPPPPLYSHNDTHTFFGQIITQKEKREGVERERKKLNKTKWNSLTEEGEREHFNIKDNRNKERLQDRVCEGEQAKREKDMACQFDINSLDCICVADICKSVLPSQKEHFGYPLHTSTTSTNYILPIHNCHFRYPQRHSS